MTDDHIASAFKHMNAIANTAKHHARRLDQLDGLIAELADCIHTITNNLRESIRQSVADHAGRLDKLDASTADHAESITAIADHLDEQVERLDERITATDSYITDLATALDKLDVPPHP